MSKAVGNAVVRNKVRRRLRHLVRPRLSSLPPGTSLVVRALPAAAAASFETLGTDLDAALAAARAPRRRR
ncbi:ribonuclease P protein component [Pseudosporangium ferrugineum]|uniref:Ribonuclease P protein component n=1 Tax=Pseudosporangium ferrugineum TaxID=439699 RepID=A0A2T0S1A0_9ACTN|nr:ribonuclease P protein component [Pseudosporangium ferrugineum]